MNKPLPASFQGTTKIDIDESSYSVDSSLLVDAATPIQQSAKKRKAEAISTPVRILNRNAGASNAVVTAKPSSSAPTTPKVVKKLPMVVVPQSNKVLKVDNYTIRQVMKSPPAAQVKIIKQDMFPTPVINQEMIQTVSIEKTELLEPSPAIVFEKPTQTVATPVVQPQEVLKPMLMDSLKQIAEIKEMLSKKQPEAASPSPKKSEEELSNISQSHLNKVQLFNGIKRYLSPSMNALLRIELFSAPHREYKKDEKIICQELLMLGDKTYNFLTEEWRLRLPAKDDVQKWVDEQITDEDDAS